MKTKLLFISMFWIGMICFSQNTYVPDNNFEQALIDLGYDTAPLNDYVPTANINTVTDLTINSRNIYDLTGIEDFTALSYLNCTNNNLSAIDLSQNTLLATLYCATNNLNAIDLSQNTLLTTMSLNNNNLSIIDVSQNTLLTFLGVSQNNFNSLDVSLNTALVELYCNINNLSTLDVTQNTLLTTLYCDNTILSDLDLSQNTVLQVLSCYSNNNLSSLNLKNGNNTILYSFNTSNSPNLECIEVDDVAWSTANWTNIDPASSFSEDCSTMSVYDSSLLEFNMYPNPVNEILIIDLDEEANYSILNLNGQILKKGDLFKGENELNISNLSKGVYFIKFEEDERVLTKKLIKQ